MKETEFRFKQFSVAHGKSSMKVGVDAVLLGAWTRCKGKRILEVGTGCGVISLILAQRNQEAVIDAIDIDDLSIEEASVNFLNSPWRERIKAIKAEFPYSPGLLNRGYDLIVSNPPYFSSGIPDPVTQREKARHQGSLSVFSLLENANKFLNENGKVSMIYPFEFHDQAIQKAKEKGLGPERVCMVRGNKRRPVKRVIAEYGFQQSKNLISGEEITLFYEGMPSPEYQQLCKELYLKF